MVSLNGRLVAMALAIVAVSDTGKAMLSVLTSLDTGRFYLNDAISYTSFLTTVATTEWLELYECPLGDMSLPPSSEIKPKHRWTVDNATDLLSSADDIVDRDTTFSEPTCTNTTITTNVSDSGAMPFYLYTGSDALAPDTADFFFSNDSSSYLWWINCHNASAVVEMVCDSGRIKLLVSDSRGSGEGILTTFATPPFGKWSGTFQGFTKLPFDGSITSEAFNLVWKTGMECSFLP